MPDVLASRGMMGVKRAPISGSLISALSRRTNAIVVATACLPEPLRSSSYTESPGRFSGLARATRRGGTPPRAGRPPRLALVLHLVGVLARMVVGGKLGFQGRVRDRQVQPVPELLQLGHGQLLH